MRPCSRRPDRAVLARRSRLRGGGGPPARGQGREGGARGRGRAADRVRLAGEGARQVHRRAQGHGGVRHRAGDGRAGAGPRQGLEHGVAVSLVAPKGRRVLRLARRQGGPLRRAGPPHDEAQPLDRRPDRPRPAAAGDPEGRGVPRRVREVGRRWPRCWTPCGARGTTGPPPRRSRAAGSATALVALDSPDATPPAGSSGCTPTAPGTPPRWRSRRSGRRVFVDVNADVLSTNLSTVA